MNISIRHMRPDDQSEWLRMRLLLWPDGTLEEWEGEISRILNNPKTPIFVAEHPDRHLCGFLEAGTRPYADGCDTNLVGYIEGWFVDKDTRSQGVGAALVLAAEEWARSIGCTEMASDTWLDNETSIRAHLSLGYSEVEKLVHFRKNLV